MTVNDTSNAVFALSGLTGHKSRIVYKYFIRNSGQARKGAVQLELLGFGKR